MNDKTTLQDLIGLLAQRHQMETTDAEVFVKTVLSLIEEALEKDKYVKIKGLGTFKLIEIEERESVDINTGERIRIQSHSRISFLPDSSLRELVNKPFSHFETVVLNENTHFDDLEEVSNIEKEETEENEEQEIVSEVEPAEQSQDLIVVETQENKVSKDVPLVKETEERENIAEHKEEMQLNLEEDKKTRLPWCMIASVLLAGVILGGGIIWGLLSGRRYIPEAYLSSLVKEQEAIPLSNSSCKDSSAVLKQVPTESVVDTLKVEQIILKKDTLKQSSERNKVSAESTAKGQVVGAKSSKQTAESLSDTVEYVISGTKFTYTIGEGETLVRVALKFYGNKKLWPYLVKHNANIIKDPNNVPAGLIINIPELTPRK